jgi:hypothetical protein
MDCRILRQITLKADGHLGCDDSVGYISGIAELKGDKLVYVEKDTTLPQYSGQGFTVVLSGKILKIQYLADPGLGIPPFCGARARLDRLVFPIEKKRPPRENLPET